MEFKLITENDAKTFCETMTLGVIDPPSRTTGGTTRSTKSSPSGFRTKMWQVYTLQIITGHLKRSLFT